MRHLLETLHIVFAIFAIGPLVHAATTAARGIKAADANAVASSARTVKIYGYLSVVVAILGVGLVQPRYDHSFGDTWVWTALVLWFVASGLVFSLILPNLQGAATALRNGSSAANLAGRVAAGGGIVALLYVAIVVLMVYKPGS
ncbi:hypothetical protein M6D93_05455 [Jatrophihabitans telluris]|uniref:DUF2269 family protein n=1 Tax=Jatrophihabitans telluris TaxID=2038343 RepID=A0ABY4R1W8_9ACTN|nr:hypothetical protein [Jatrophihabitans telluris]UQX89452.1 hypothetical protein M6D93_05455 [Jatrophihabitans telluris]